MAPHVKGTPAALVTNQANQSNLPISRGFNILLKRCSPRSESERVTRSDSILRLFSLLLSFAATRWRHVAEKIISTRLNEYLEINNILIPEQHGFRPRLSTTHQLLRVVEYIKEGNNMGQCTAAAFLDIQKAFDRVYGTQAYSSN
ncbi:RNA-directed DNA polymerase from mobile element jockey [Trichonephila clavipes]|nr:RNA-directed DNA polymerase from mobile element jockey [Trichonephila clavipes]